MLMKRVRTLDDIVFESAEPPVTLPKGREYGVEAVTEQGVVLQSDDGERFMIDLETFEQGFEAAELRDARGLTEAEAIARHRAANYPKPALTADVAVFAKMDGTWRLLMIRRGGHPYLGCWALPGGFADANEPIERTAARELEEETGVKGLPLRLVNVYSAPGRDPRGWTVSAAYAACVPEGGVHAVAGDDAAETQWMEISVPDAAVRLPDDAGIAFDHAQIIADAIRLCAAALGE